MPCALPQEGGHVVMGRFPGAVTAWGSGGPALWRSLVTLGASGSAHLGAGEVCK